MQRPIPFVLSAQKLFPGSGYPIHENDDSMGWRLEEERRDETRKNARKVLKRDLPTHVEKIFTQVTFVAVCQKPH